VARAAAAAAGAAAAATTTTTAVPEKERPKTDSGSGSGSGSGSRSSSSGSNMFDAAFAAMAAPMTSALPSPSAQKKKATTPLGSPAAAAAPFSPPPRTTAAGATAAVALVTRSHVVLANIGDARAVLFQQLPAADDSDQDEGAAAKGGKENRHCHGAWVVRSETTDHKPGSQREKRRIERAGGTVSEEGRIVQGRQSLGVSRALGDFHFKTTPSKQPAVGGGGGGGSGASGPTLSQALSSSLSSSSLSVTSPAPPQPRPVASPAVVSSEPDVHSMPRRPGEAIVLACDGVWDVCSSQQAGRRIQASLAAAEGGEGKKEKDETTQQPQPQLQRHLARACDDLVLSCMDSRDNITCMAVVLH
jgi:serine/threonine protein phosphatase PrpC